MKQVTDTGAIEAAVDEVIAANPAQVEKAKANPKLAGWFVGQVMKATRRQGQPQGGERDRGAEAGPLGQPGGDLPEDGPLSAAAPPDRPHPAGASRCDAGGFPAAHRCDRKAGSGRAVGAAGRRTGIAGDLALYSRPAQEGQFGMTLYEFLVPVFALALAGAAVAVTRSEARRLDARIPVRTDDTRRPRDIRR